MISRLFWTNDVYRIPVNWESLEKVLLDLPSDEFHAIYLRFKCNYTFKEIGEDFDSTMSYGRHIVDYTLRRLRRPKYLFQFIKTEDIPYIDFNNFYD